MHHAGDRVLGRNLSYKKRETWLSEIDLWLVKYQIFNVIKKLEVNQCIKGSDHLPLCVELDSQQSRVHFFSLLFFADVVQR